ncbi:MAG TPA: carboxypeptidase-like regulatory domain-containing protein, partial [Planctomycetota bacterium]|nr:carboxypeptidase-like regulatory domain-containing protein [Planctomycetota bacterium]
GQPVEVRLSRGPSLVGVVTDPGGWPAPDVPVFLHVTRQFTDAPPPDTTVARTDDLGRFRFSPLPPGEYAIALLEADNAVDRLSGLRVEAGTVDVSLPLPHRHQLVISVADREERPIQDAVVELSGSGTTASGRTLASGQAVLRHLVDGDYELTIEREGYQPVRERLQLAGGSGDSVRWFRLDPLPGP